MDIKYFGHSSFFIKGKSGTVVTDPFSPDMTGLKFPKNIEADIVTVSHDHDDHNAVSLVSDNAFVIKGPGEYEIKNISILGFASYHDTENGLKRGNNTIYKIEMDGISVVHLGDLGHILTEEAIDNIGGVDILMIPVGGFYTINAQSAKKLIADIDPYLVLPMHYNRPDLDKTAFKDLTSLDDFLKEMDVLSLPKVPKLTISKDKMPEETQIVIFE